MFSIVKYEHVGIRVSDRENALRFYEKLGFREAAYFPELEAGELVTAHGIYINLIYNGTRRTRNVLMDEAVKYPGVTHPAFVVDSLKMLLETVERENIEVTEGPVFIGARRKACFIRDPDGNVLEFDELCSTPQDAAPPQQDMNMIKLYDLELSGNCYKVRLFLSLLHLEYEPISIDLIGGENRSPQFLDLNPLGEIPVLEDGSLVLRDSQAILVYLAKRYGGEAWLPTDPAGEAQVIQWLSTAANEIAQGPNAARLHQRFGAEIDLQAAQQRAHKSIGFFEEHLSNNSWLALNRPTIADVACFPYIGLAPEGGVSLAEYNAVNQWIDRIKALPGYLTMPGL